MALVQQQLVIGRKKRTVITNLAADEAKGPARKAADIFAQTGGLYPMNAPGMPPVGKDFLEMAEHLSAPSLFENNEEGRTSDIGAQVMNLTYRALREVGFTMPVLFRGGQSIDATFVPGHIWKEDFDAVGTNTTGRIHGPKPATVMVVGKHPGWEEVNAGRNFYGETSRLFVEILRQEHVKGTPDWYVTNLVKFQPPPGAALTARWLADCLPLLHQELRLVRPRYVLLVGSDASKALLGKKMGVEAMEGRVIEYEFPLDLEYKADPEERVVHKCLVMTTIHPAAVSRQPDQRRQLENAIIRFNHLQNGNRWDKEELDIDHRTIRTIEQLEALIKEIEVDPRKTDNWISVDAEWHGEHPQNEGSYVRTIQFSWLAKCAACIVWNDTEGKCAFTDVYGRSAQKRGIEVLNAFFAGKRVIGHFLVADLEWLVPLGLTNILAGFRVPLDGKNFDDFEPWAQQELAENYGYAAGDFVPAFFRATVEGGHDTGLAAHAIEETAKLGLETLTVRYCETVPRYDAPLNEWIERYCKEKGITRKHLEGYGVISDDTIIPYACLHMHSLVQLADGSWEKISKLVASKYAGKVKALIDGEVVNATVTGWHRASVGQQDWFKLRTISTYGGRWGILGPTFTPDHEIITQRGKVRVDSLICGEDKIATDEREFTADQLSVFLGCLLGDGGYTQKHDCRFGFGFGQCADRASYADWKAQIFASYRPKPVTMKKGDCRYVITFSKYITHLASVFPARDAEDHGKRKAKITLNILSKLGDLGIAVWYQDDGTLVKPNGGRQFTSRIYCKINADEQDLVVSWFTSRFGAGVSYNCNNRFIQFTKTAFISLHKAIRPFIHPAMSYKTVSNINPDPYVPATTTGKLFYETIEEVVRYTPPGGRGHGVRYCLSVLEAGNFLTAAGFVSNCYDPDATYRLAEKQWPLLDEDYDGNNVRESFWESMLTVPVILEMHQTGLTLDRDRLDYLTAAFMKAKDDQEIKIKTWANWPNFNIRSVMAVREFLFGEAYNGKRSKDGRMVRIRPDVDDPNGPANCLNVQPLLDTSKPPKRWEEIAARNEESQHNAGTGKAILSVLAQDNLPVADQINWIRDYRFLDQVLKSVLRPPKVNEDGSLVLDDAGSIDHVEAAGIEASPYTFGTDNLGGVTYDAGLGAVICGDGRVRTHMYPTTETKRWRHARPNLANMAKRRDPDYARLLGGQKNAKGKWVGGNYKYKLRSLLKANPGCLLVEADFKSAELFVVAIMSGDPTMIDHVSRNLLPEEDPNYMDLHSNTAVKSFGLDCAPTKKGLESVGRISLRVAAKNILFGILYGRGAKAIALQCKEEGNPISVEQAQQIIDTIFRTYPKLVAFFDHARERCHDPGWLCGMFGAFRRFSQTDDRQMQGEFERQSMNFGVQNAVASAMDRALAYMDDYRTNVLRDPNYFKFALQMHDAGLWHVPYANIPTFLTEVLPINMCERLELYPTNLAGVPLGTGPYHMGIDIEVSDHWGEKPTKEFCIANDIPLSVETSVGLIEIAA